MAWTVPLRQSRHEVVDGIIEWFLDVLCGFILANDQSVPRPTSDPAKHDVDNLPL